MTGARDPGAWARLIVLGMIWGASFIATEVALEGFPPLTLVAGRITVAALTLAALAHALGRGLPRWRGPQGRGYGALRWPSRCSPAPCRSAC